MKIIPYEKPFREQVIELTLSAWESVFPKTQRDVPSFVYDNFWPQGWETRQAREVSKLIDEQPGNVWLALDHESVIGFVGVSLHPEDQMGEISIIAVSPSHQRLGVGRSLLDFAESHIRSKGMKMVMVETVGDSGHDPARKAYESQGYIQWPVARYFKEL